MERKERGGGDGTRQRREPERERTSRKKSTSAARKKKRRLAGERKKWSGGMRTIIASGLVEIERETRRAGWHENGRTYDATTPAGAGGKGRT